MKTKKFIPVAQPALIGNEKKYVVDCLDTNWISSNGKYIHMFEDAFADYIGVKYAVACANGTVALHLALVALGIGPGDEVIVPSLTYVATANAVTYTGARPVFADSEADTWNIDPFCLEPLINSNTKAIIAVPLYGHPCDMDEINAIARKHNLSVIEDAAEALGSLYKGKKCGSLAEIATFSFYGNKTITTGEGGMVVTDNAELAERVKLFRGQGVDPEKRYWFKVVGYNYRITNIQSAIGLAQLENIERFVEKRRQIASMYNRALSGIESISRPMQKAYAFHSYWMYSILIDNSFGKNRDAVMQSLLDKGIDSRPFFYPMHAMPAYKQTAGSRLDVSVRLAAQGINLPTYYDLKQEDIIYIADCLSGYQRV